MQIPPRRRKSGLSFSAIIGMSLLAVLVGFLLGNFMIRMMTTAADEEEQQERMEVFREEELLQQDESEFLSGELEEQADREPPAEPEEFYDNDGEEIAAGNGYFRVQVGSFESQSQADSLKEELEEAGYPVFLTPAPPHRIQVGAFSERENAQMLADEMREQGYTEVYINAE